MKHVSTFSSTMNNGIAFRLQRKDKLNWSQLILRTTAVIYYSNPHAFANILSDFQDIFEHLEITEDLQCLVVRECIFFIAPANECYGHNKLLTWLAINWKNNLILKSLLTNTISMSRRSMHPWRICMALGSRYIWIRRFSIRNCFIGVTRYLLSGGKDIILLFIKNKS